MSYLVLARKWRPQTFEEVIGQEHVTRTLTNAIRKGKIHHAFLFTGTRGVGKTTAARILAKSLCCLSEDHPVAAPCNECASCREITAGNSVDVTEIDGASNRGIDDIRDLQQSVMYRPQRSRYRIYIIDEVHMLTKEAFNALLKTLEEPPEHVKFIFATTEANKILPTILSRCQRYDFKMISARAIAEHLSGMLSAENVPFSEGAIRLVARYARGSMRDAQSLLDRVLAYIDGELTEEDVQTVLGVADRTRIYEVTRKLIEGDGAGLFDLVDDLASHGVELKQFCGELLEHIRNGVVALNHREPGKLLDLPDAELAELKRQTAALSAQDVWLRWFDILYANYDHIARGAFDRLMFETALAKMIHVTPMRPLDDLIDRVRGWVEAENRGGNTAGRGPTSPAPRGQAPRSGGETRPVETPSAARNEPAREAISIDCFRTKNAKTESKGGDFKRWSALVADLMETQREWWLALWPMKFLSWNGAMLELAAPTEWLHKRFSAEIQRLEAQEILAKLAKEPVELRVYGLERAGEGRSVEDVEQSHLERNRNDLMQEALDHPTVQAVREAFGGGEVTLSPLLPEENYDDEETLDNDEAIG